MSMNGQYPVETTASFTCDSGYKLKGPNSRSCQATGTWTQRTPDCEQSKELVLCYLRNILKSPYNN